VGSFLLAKRQGHFERRVTFGEFLIMAVFVVLMITCFVDMHAVSLFSILAMCVFSASVGTVFAQNGSFAIASALSESHTQAIMIGQAISGVLPPIVSILTTGRGISAVGSALYFLAAVLMAALAQWLFAKIRQRPQYSKLSSTLDDGSVTRTNVPLALLAQKLWVPALSVFMVFGVTLAYPVFASVVESSNGIRPELFVPLVFLVWNLGDFHGRQLCARPRYVIHKGELLLVYSVARLIFVAALFLMNIRGRGIIHSDLIYLATQYFFGVTNGYLASCSLMTAPSYVDKFEREAAGGFMTLSLSCGLAVGSIASFGLAWLTQ
jgi:equilibrative nucleoside transporter 1/2/3